MEREVPVDGPPHPVQDIKKSRRIVAFDRKPPCKRAVNMFVCIDKRGHDQAAFGVDILRACICRTEILRGSDPADCGAVHRHCPVFDERT